MCVHAYVLVCVCVCNWMCEEMSSVTGCADQKCPALLCPAAFGSGPGFGSVATGGSSFGFSSSKPSGGSLSAGALHPLLSDITSINGVPLRCRVEMTSL